MSDRIRLRVATILSWLAARVGPRCMRPVFTLYGRLLGDMPKQFASGRTYGVVSAVWSMTDEGYAKAVELQNAALAAMAETRRAQEVTND